MVCRVHAWTCLLASTGLSLVLIIVRVLGRPTGPLATCGHGPRTCYRWWREPYGLESYPCRGERGFKPMRHMRTMGLVGDAGCSCCVAFCGRWSTCNWLKDAPLPTRAGLTCPCVFLLGVRGHACCSWFGSMAVAAGCGGDGSCHQRVALRCARWVVGLGMVRVRDSTLRCVWPCTRSALVGRRARRRRRGVASAAVAEAAYQWRRWRRRRQRRRQRWRRWCFMDQGSLSSIEYS